MTNICETCNIDAKEHYEVCKDRDNLLDVCILAEAELMQFYTLRESQALREIKKAIDGRYKK